MTRLQPRVIRPTMHHPALSFKLPMTHREQIEMRGALLSSLARIQRLETELETLTFIIQQQIQEIEALCRIPSPLSSQESKINL